MATSSHGQLVDFLLCCSFLFFLLSGAAASAATAVRTHVASLPGFDGPLPFRLETGYVSVDEKNGADLFYYFIESEGDPRRDPVLLWLTGGDRCSVLSALFFEIGPVKFIMEPYNGSLPRLRYHPHAWTKAASVLFVDSPVGAGFSFARKHNGYIVGDVSASLQLKKFLIKWFTEHSYFLANPLYLGGDSYAGKIIPFIVQKISEDLEAGLKPALNLNGYVTGNPRTGEFVDSNSRVPFAHGMGIISDQLYDELLEHCAEDDIDRPKKKFCVEAFGRFNKLLDQVFKGQILYDNKCIFISPRSNNDATSRKILKEEIGDLNHPPPRPPFECRLTYKIYLLYFWANNKSTREALGIKKGTKDEFTKCHDGELPYTRDLGSTLKFHHNVTTKGYRALIYSGDHDAVTPFLGTQAWVRSLNFSVADDWRAWHVHDQSAGFTIRYSNDMTFATVKGAGHTAPEFEPERCLAMITRWLSNKPL